LQSRKNFVRTVAEGRLKGLVMADDTKEPKAPYVPFGTFLNFLDSQAEAGLPSTIDKSLMSKMSGGIQSMLLAALRATGFIDDGGHPKPRFDRYVAGTATERKTVVREGLSDAFPYLVAQDIDLKRMTPGQFDKRIKDATGVSSSTLDKVASFFLGAAKHIDLPISSHLEGRKPTFKSTKRAKSETAQFQEPATNANGNEKRVGLSGIQAPPDGISDKALEYKLIDLMKEEGVGAEQMEAIWTLVQYLTAKGKVSSVQISTLSKDNVLFDL
jgi:Family of unknown function (DUF5343)